MKRILTSFLLLLILVTVNGHPWKPRHYVIIDTDGGLDDLKAICMLLSSPDVRVLGITVSDGFNKQDVAYTRIRAMLDNMWHEGLQVAEGDRAIDLIGNLLANETSPVKFVSLGTLRTAAEAIEKVPGFTSRISGIYWSNGGLDDRQSFNFRADPAAAEKVLASPLPVSVAGSGGSAFYSDELITDIGGINTAEAKEILSVINANKNHSFVYDAFDELIPLLIHYPALFMSTDESAKNRYFEITDQGPLRRAFLRILKGETVAKMQVIKQFPADTGFYMTDIQPFIEQIIERNGEDEWSSGILANELHRHLGVFAIIGVKMGVRAREYFCTGVDEFNVTTFCGDISPLSCMNDGIQVSTGATPGHGLLSVSPDKPYFAGATFRFKDRTLTIRLKPELAEKISSELKEINFIYGLDSDIYWELVRQKAVRYWAEMDRHDIFDISPGE